MWLNTNSLSVVSIILILINFIKILCTATGVDIQVQSVSAEGAAEWHDNITSHGWQCHHIADNVVTTSHHMLTMSSHHWQCHHIADNVIKTSHHMLTVSSHMADNVITSLTMTWRHHITWLTMSSHRWQWHDDITSHRWQCHQNITSHGWQCHHITDNDITTSHHMLTMSTSITNTCISQTNSTSTM